MTAEVPGTGIVFTGSKRISGRGWSPPLDLIIRGQLVSSLWKTWGVGVDGPYFDADGPVDGEAAIITIEGSSVFITPGA
jgi:hypothetical protein